MQWVEYDRRGNNPNKATYDPSRIGMELSFNIYAETPGGIVVKSSDGRMPNFADDGSILSRQPFDPDMFNQFQITVDQLEGEITLPYTLEREIRELNLFGNITLYPVQKIITER